MHRVRTTYMKNHNQKSAEIINIGDELLAGHTLNSNATWMSSALKNIGIKVLKHLVIADEKEAIISALDQVSPQADYIFVTGGLGPTEDDRTKAVITSYFGGELLFSEEIFAEVLAFFAKRGRVPSESNKGQAVFPNNAKRIVNTKGTASGMIFEREGKKYYIMPGVPYEMQSMMLASILPQFSQRSLNLIEEYQINTFGLPESYIADKITEVIPQDINVGYYPSVKGITIRLNGKDDGVLKKTQEKIIKILGMAVYSTSNESMEDIVVNLCMHRQFKISVAESCTGGLTASMITDVPGSSEIFKQSYVVYSNEAKIKELGVSEDVIKKHGAVSTETVEAMARGLKIKTGADITIGISGIAGPDGAVPGKEVGLIYIAVLFNDKLRIKKLNYDRGRKKNKEYAARAALNEVRLAILEIE